jgi:hypothetical protein
MAAGQWKRVATSEPTVFDGASSVEPAERKFVEQVASAGDLAAIAAVCTTAGGLPRHVDDGSARERFRNELARALHTHLARVSDHPAFVHWLDTYFGVRRAEFRSRLQQPNFLYYPALPPTAWFDTGQVPELLPIRNRIGEVGDELRGFLASTQTFSPYVPAESRRDPRWSSLADNLAWSAMHLLRREAWNEPVLAGLPRTRSFLMDAPLAQYPPHAPECFISRLLPGVVLPPHFGLSNIKLTVHLPVDLPPEGCTITVANVTRSWSPDDFLVFDDSFLHSAANLAAASRTVLIFDTWHPGLSDVERTALAYSIQALDRVKSAVGDRL